MALVDFNKKNRILKEQITRALPYAEANLIKAWKDFRTVDDIALANLISVALVIDVAPVIEAINISKKKILEDFKNLGLKNYKEYKKRYNLE